MTNKKIGYSCDIALQELLGFYTSCDQFLADCQDLNSLPELVEYRLSKMKRLSRGEGLVISLVNYRDNYTRLSKEWQHDWEALCRPTMNNLISEVEKLADKWGLKCDWGRGFILDTAQVLYPLKSVLHPPQLDRALTAKMRLSNRFMVSPAPPSSSGHLTTEITIYDTEDSLKRKIAEFKKRAKKLRANWQKHLDALDFRGFEKQPKKDIATQVLWLFWHVTPPYLNAAEIAINIQISQGQDVDQFYIQRCYQKVAGILNIKLMKGWTKGRKRASQQTRSKLQEAELKAKKGLKNQA